MSRLAPVVLILVCNVVHAQSSQRTPCVPPAGTTLVEFRSGTNILRGFIDLPQRAGKHPAILIIHGAAPTDVTADTNYFAELRKAFGRAGIATLIWDKAGNGCSSGAYSSELPIRERATETLAALKALQERDDIDSSRIGIWALSQGGWVAPMAAVRSNGIAYLIIVSGPGRDAISQGAYLGSNLLREAGVAETEAEKAYAMLRRASAIAIGGGSPEEFTAALEPLQKYSALRQAGMPDLASAAYLRVFGTGHDFSIHDEESPFGFDSKRRSDNDWSDTGDRRLLRNRFQTKRIVNCALENFRIRIRTDKCRRPVLEKVSRIR
jgi:hypothetical protein